MEQNKQISLCQYGFLCKNNRCIFIHPEQLPLQLIGSQNLQNNSCQIGQNCFNKNCLSIHPGQYLVSDISRISLCKFGANCTKINQNESKCSNIHPQQFQMSPKQLDKVIRNQNHKYLEEFYYGMKQKLKNKLNNNVTRQDARNKKELANQQIQLKTPCKYGQDCLNKDTTCRFSHKNEPLVKNSYDDSSSSDSDVYNRYDSDSDDYDAQRRRRYINNNIQNTNQPKITKIDQLCRYGQQCRNKDSYCRYKHSLDRNTNRISTALPHHRQPPSSTINSMTSHGMSPIRMPMMGQHTRPINQNNVLQQQQQNNFLKQQQQQQKRKSSEQQQQQKKKEEEKEKDTSKDDEKACKVCFAEQATYIAIECMHVILCKNCYQMYQDKNKCVMCRKIGTIKKMFF